MQSAIQALSRISKHSPPQIGFAAAEVKITYAENAGMSTQLYEVDVFMFFLKDLEAVTTNFYHDLWQSTRMHTPKVRSALCSLLFSTLTAILCTGAMPSYALDFSN